MVSASPYVVVPPASGSFPSVAHRRTHLSRKEYTLFASPHARSRTGGIPWGNPKTILARPCALQQVIMLFWTAVACHRFQPDGLPPGRPDKPGCTKAVASHRSPMRVSRRGSAKIVLFLCVVQRSSGYNVPSPPESGGLNNHRTQCCARGSSSPRKRGSR